MDATVTPDGASSGTDADVVVVGAGIIGLATAFMLTRDRPDVRVMVFDKEREVAQHQSGRNSGVVHSGLYYRPGSEKARLVARGRRVLADFAAEHGVPVDVCGKVVVATRQDELQALGELARRGAENGLEVHRIGPAELHELEPHVRGIAALHVPSAAITDYGAVARAIVAALHDRGVELRTASNVDAIDGTAGSDVLTVGAGPSTVTTRVLVNCAGLHSDRIARLAGARTDVSIVPFRGEYSQLAQGARGLVRNLVYPVADPRWPFLGVHLTRMIDGEVHVGPNALLALGREAYAGGVDLRDTRALLADPGLRRLASRYWRTGSAELVRSRSRRLLLRDVRRLVPDVEDCDLMPAEAGIRAQALAADGTLLDDFAFGSSHRAVHVLNAPSPAATAAFAIGEVVARRAGAVLDGGPTVGIGSR